MSIRTAGSGLARAAAFATLLLLGGHARAADVLVYFDHLNPDPASKPASLQAGDKLHVIIQNTCPEKFEYGITPKKDESAASTKNNNVCPPASKTLEPIVHEASVGEYTVTITGADLTVGEKRVLKAQTFTVLVGPASPWTISLSGGFTVGGLTEAKYSLGSRTGSDGQPENFVQRSKDGEDDYRLGFAGFVHTSHRSWVYKDIKPALTFGLGMGDDNDVSYFLGPSVQLGEFFLTAGWHIGPTNSLKGALKDGDSTTATAIDDVLDKHNEGSWFIGLSYSFLSNGVPAALSKKLSAE